MVDYNKAILCGQCNKKTLHIQGRIFVGMRTFCDVGCYQLFLKNIELLEENKNANKASQAAKAV